METSLDVYKSVESFALQTYPIICACDTLHILVCLPWPTLRTRFPRTAIHILESRPVSNLTMDEETSLAKILGTTIFRIAIFSLRAIP